MRKRRIPNTLFLAIMVICITVINVVYVSRHNLNEIVERRAYDELETSVTMQASYLAHALELQYAPIESLANYMGAKEYCSTEQDDVLFSSFASSNQFSEYGYATKDGIAVDCNGKVLGDISSYRFFYDIVEQGASRSVQYLESSYLSESPRIVLAVPVFIDNRVQGVLFVSKERNIFEEILLGDGFKGEEISFIVNADGNFIAMNEASHNYFESRGSYVSKLYNINNETINADRILDEIKNNKSGKVRVEGHKTDYVVYTPLGVNNWSLFSIAESSSVTKSYSENLNSFMFIIYSVSFAFLVSLLYILVTTVLYTRRSNKEKAMLRFETERSHKLLEEMNSIVYDLNMTNYELKVSEAFENLFGYSLPSDLVHRIQTNTYDGANMDYRILLEGIQRVKETKKSTYIEMLFRTLSDIKWIRVTMTPFYTDDDTLASIYGLITDVTEEHKAIEEYSRMLSLAPGGMRRCYLSEPVHLEYASDGLCRMLGYSREEFELLVGDLYINAILEEDRPIFKNFIKKLAEKPATLTCKYRMLCKDGSVLYVSDTTESIRNDSGIMYGYSSVTDVTKYEKEQKHLEEKAMLDEHTSLPNKSSCEHLFRDTSLINIPTCCIMFDMDGLKTINDSKGHVVGDMMIRQFATILGKVIRENDFVGRYGGDEFVAVLYDVDELTVENVISRINDEVKRFNIVEEQFSISYSCGYAISNEMNHCTLKDLLIMADSKMYINKKNRKKNTR